MGSIAISGDEFAGLLRSFSTSAVRLETRDRYALEYEAADFGRFLAGSPVPPPAVDWWRPWLEQIAALTRAGRTVARVRVLAEPPTDYQQWELWAAPWHARAGEQIGYITRSKAEAIGLPLDLDWWVLDGERLILMWFDAAGRPDGMLLVTDPETVARHLAWWDLAVRHAIPAEEITAA